MRQLIHIAGKHSFSARLAMCIFSTSFVLLLTGGIILFGASIKATTGMNRSFTTANMQITAENIDKTLQQVDESVQLAFTQKGVLQALQQPWGDELEAYETLHHALSVAVASDDTICYMSLCSDENGILSSQTNRRLHIPMQQNVEPILMDSLASIKKVERAGFF